jgi:hypothetical protein
MLTGTDATIAAERAAEEMVDEGFEPCRATDCTEDSPCWGCIADWLEGEADRRY